MNLINEKSGLGKPTKNKLIEYNSPSEKKKKIERSNWINLCFFSKQK